MIEYTLLVKGPMAIAKKEAEERGFKVRSVRAGGRFFRESIIEARHAKADAAHRWFGEEPPGVPMAWGSLLYFTSLNVERLTNGLAIKSTWSPWNRSDPIYDLYY